MSTQVSIVDCSQIRQQTALMHNRGIKVDKQRHKTHFIIFSQSKLRTARRQVKVAWSNYLYIEEVYITSQAGERGKPKKVMKSYLRRGGQPCLITQK